MGVQIRQHAVILPGEVRLDRDVARGSTTSARVYFGSRYIGSRQALWEPERMANVGYDTVDSAWTDFLVFTCLAGKPNPGILFRKCSRESLGVMIFICIDRTR